MCPRRMVGGCATLLPRHGAMAIVIRFTSLVITAMFSVLLCFPEPVLLGHGQQRSVCVSRFRLISQNFAASPLARPYSQGQPEQQRLCRLARVE